MITRRTSKDIYFSVRDSVLLKACAINNGVRNLITADFCTLFIKLDHDSIFTKCFFLIDLRFRNSKRGPRSNSK